MPASRRVIPTVVFQHVEDAVVLRAIRSSLVRAPHVKLHHLRRTDERLAANLNGILLSGDEGWRMCAAELEKGGTAEAFVAGTQALAAAMHDQWEGLVALTEVNAAAARGILSACGWTPASQLGPIVKALVEGRGSHRQALGIAVCGLHRADPGTAVQRALRDESPDIRVVAHRAAGLLGAIDCLPECQAALRSGDAAVQFWASWSSVLLGARGVAVDALELATFSSTPPHMPGFQLLLQALPQADAHVVLQRQAEAGEKPRLLFEGSGIVGDPTYVSWLIGHMSDDAVARLAGEAFSLITGTDLALLDLERKPPEDFESGPSDNPDDPDVSMDPDDGLPWPDQGRIQMWWQANGHRFQNGQRYFMGAPVTREHCIDVLKNGYQRQRVLAAHYLCLLNPGTPLFNTGAPAWRQQRLLERMS
jgi:uncharacterized protein (TIGR02270 family)